MTETREIEELIASYITEIPMIRWLTYSRRYGVDLATIQQDGISGHFTETLLICANEARRRENGGGPDAFDELEAMTIEQISEVLFAAVDEPEDQRFGDLSDDADKSGAGAGVGSAAGHVLPGHGATT